VAAIVKKLIDVDYYSGGFLSQCGVDDSRNELAPTPTARLLPGLK
jgi:hypothetical protein